MNSYNSFIKVLFSSLFLVIISELTKLGGVYIILTFFIALLFILFSKKISFLEIFCVLIIISSYGQILRGANGYVTYLSLIFLFVYLIKYPSFKFKFPSILLLIILPQLFSIFIFDRDLSSSIPGFISLLGVFSSVVFIKNINWNKSNIYFFLKILCVLPYLSLAIEVFSLLNLDLSLFLTSQSVSLENDFLNLNKYGAFGSSELMGEAMMLCSLVSYNLLSRSNSDRKYFIFSLFFSLVLVILCFSRTIIILTALGLIISIIFGPSKKFKKLPIVVIIFIVSQLNLNYLPLVEKFSSNENYLNAFFENPFTAEGTSREYVFKIARDKIKTKPYIFGDGYGLVEENKNTWLGLDSDRWADYHNLYYSIIPIFGWITLIILLIFYFKIISKSLKYFLMLKQKESFNSNIFFIFLITTTSLIIGEFKINALRTGGYLYLFFSTLFVFYNYSKQKTKNLIN